MPLRFIGLILGVILVALFVTQVLLPLLMRTPMFSIFRKDKRVLSQAEVELNQQLENEAKLLEIQSKMDELIKKSKERKSTEWEM